MPAPTGRNAFGLPVPTVRQVAALDCAVENLGVDALLADPVIRDAAAYVHMDEPDKALLVLRNIVDLTGAYRLLAVLCTADEAESASFWLPPRTAAQDQATWQAAR